MNIDLRVGRQPLNSDDPDEGASIVGPFMCAVDSSDLPDLLEHCGGVRINGVWFERSLDQAATERFFAAGSQLDLSPEDS